MAPALALTARLRMAAALLGIWLAIGVAVPAAAQPVDRPGDAPAPAWADILERADGQVVRLHAWGGDPKINAYIDWAGAELAARHGVTLLHVKLAATTEAVAQVLADRLGGRESGGGVDAIWIYGENFRTMKEAGLLYGPFVADLPNFRYVDT